MNQRPSNIELAKKFKTFRLSGQHEAAAEMITEDAYAIPPISMFGEMHGRDKIKQFWIDHYDENQEVTFEEPEVEGHNGVLIKGTMKKLFMNWDTELRLTFTADGKICKLQMNISLF